MRYDCSSADVKPIGGIGKTDLKKFIAWACTKFDLPILKDFLAATQCFLTLHSISLIADAARFVDSRVGASRRRLRTV